MPFSSSIFSRSRKSFSLTELMIAIAITSVLMFFFTQILGTVERTIKLSTQMIDSTSQARFVFDRIGLDLKSMPIRSDIDYHMTNAPMKEDFLRILSGIYGPEGNRPLSLIGYQIMTDENGIDGLYRGVRGYSWDTMGFMGFSSNQSAPSLLNLPEGLTLRDKDYEEIGSGIFRAEIAFQIKNTGKILRDPPFVTSTNRYSPARAIQITNIGSVIVTLATFDVKYKKMMNQELSDLLRSKFPIAPEGITPAAFWNTNLEYHFPEFAEGLPKPVAQSVRVFQRFYNIESQ
ncbi:MAG: prepilin-type N-terminal cleavage/methylation domain-containing protein [Verrucomicrobiota bacterium]